MSARDNRVALLRLAYEAFNRRDVDAVLSMLNPEVEWPNLLDRATAHGPDPVREHWNRQFKQIDPHVQPTASIPLRRPHALGLTARAVLTPGSASGSG